MWYGNEHVERLFVRGVEPEYTFAQPLFTVAEGRFISPYDLEHARKQPPAVTDGNGNGCLPSRGHPRLAMSHA